MIRNLHIAYTVFEVGGANANDKGSEDEIKLLTTKFYAHHIILQKAAPLLAELIITEKSPSQVPSCNS